MLCTLGTIGWQLAPGIPTRMVMVAVGEGTNTIAWSSDGITWNGVR